MQWITSDRPERRIRAVIAAVGATVILSACDSGAVTAPDGSMAEAGGERDTNRGSTTNGGGGSVVETYVWGLPPSDISVTGNDGPMYASLQQSCQEGEDFLNEAWEGFRSPRNVVLFAAGVKICRGDVEGGRAYFQHAATVYGFGGLQPEGRAECDVYKSVRSVLEQQPRSDFPCPAGSAPPWKTGPDSRKDNPLTFAIDESAGSTETPAEPAPDTPAEPIPETPEETTTQ